MKINFNWLIIFCFLFCNVCYAQTDQMPKADEDFFVAQKAYNDGFYDVALNLLEHFDSKYPGYNQSIKVDLLIGQCYFNQNRFLDALKKFQSLLNNPQAKDIKETCLLWIAEVHFKGNNFAKAREFYNMILKDFPKSSYYPLAFYSVGWCLYQEHKYKEALDYFNKVEENFPGQAQSYEIPFKVLECLYNLKDYSALKLRVRRYLKDYTFDKAKLAYFYFYLAESDYYLNNLLEAISGYEQVVINNPDLRMVAISRLSIFWSYLKLKQYEQADKSLSQINPDNLDKKNLEVFYSGQAILNAETARYKQAKVFYEKLIEVSSDDRSLAEGYLGKADMLYNLAEYKSAAKIYSEGAEKIALLPGLEEFKDRLYYGLVQSLIKDGQFNEAFRRVQQISEKEINFNVKFDILLQIGLNYQGSKDYSHAIEVFKEIIKNYPDNKELDYVYYQLGFAYLNDNNYNSAISVLSKFEKNFAGSKYLADVWYALALAYFQNQDYDLAIKLFERFQDVFKDNIFLGKFKFIAAKAYLAQNQYEQALNILRQVISSFSEDIDLAKKAEFEIADCFFKMGKEDEALARFNGLRGKYKDPSFNSQVLWWLGQYYYNKNDFTLANRYFISLVLDYPNSELTSNAHYIIGIIYSKDPSTYQLAVESFNKVLENGPKTISIDAAGALAKIYIELKKEGLAMDTYKKLANKYPDLQSYAYINLGDIYYDKANFNEAIGVYRKGLLNVSRKEAARLKFKIAQALQAQGSNMDAITNYIGIADMHIEDKELAVKALLRAAKLYEDIEDYKEAGKIYERIARMQVKESEFAREKLELLKR